MSEAVVLVLLVNCIFSACSFVFSNQILKLYDLASPSAACVCAQEILLKGNL